MDSFIQRFAQGEVILLEGSRGDRTYQILKGRVYVCKRNADQELVVIDQLGAGEIFGEMYLMDEFQERNATIIAATETLCNVTFEDEFIHAMPASNRLRGILLEIGKRVAKTSERYSRRLSQETGQAVCFDVPSHQSQIIRPKAKR